MPLHKYKVRDGFRRYGARVYFNQDQQVTAIYDYAQDKIVKPGDTKDWEAAKYLAKTTALTLVTVREHLVWTHFTLSLTMTRLSTAKLPPTHPLRRLLTIFTFRSTEVNKNALTTLVQNNTLLHRATAFEFDALGQLYSDAYKASNVFDPFSKLSHRFS